MSAVRRVVWSAGLLVSCAHAFALPDRSNWTTLWHQMESHRWGYTIFLDTVATKQVAPNAWQAWVISDYDTALVDPQGRRYASEAERLELDCTKRTIRSLEVVRYDSVRSGVVSRGPGQNPPELVENGYQVPPKGTVIYAIWSRSCRELQGQGWTYETQ
jgi:hypothetical protein